MPVSCVVRNVSYIRIRGSAVAVPTALVCEKVLGAHAHTCTVAHTHARRQMHAATSNGIAFPPSLTGNAAPFDIECPVRDLEAMTERWKGTICLRLHVSFVFRLIVQSS